MQLNYGRDAQIEAGRNRDGRGDEERKKTGGGKTPKKTWTEERGRGEKTGGRMAAGRAPERAPATTSAGDARVGPLRLAMPKQPTNPRRDKGGKKAAAWRKEEEGKTREEGGQTRRERIGWGRAVELAAVLEEEAES